MNQTSPSAHAPNCTCGSPTEHHYSCPLYSHTSKPKIKENNVGWDTNPTSIHRVSQNKKEGWEEEFDKKSNEDTFGQMSADTAKDIFRHILHEREEEMVKSFSDEMRDRILYIGDEIPDSLAKDKRDKFILLGIPDEVINIIIKQ